MAHDVFVSYCSEDKATADAVCATLESQRIRCWIAPRDIVPGEDWPEAIMRALYSARVLVLVLTARANESPEVRREVERAVSKGLIVIPLRIEDVKPSASLMFFLGGKHWLDALTPPLAAHLKRLCTTVRALLGEPAPAAEEASAPPPLASAGPAAPHPQTAHPTAAAELPPARPSHTPPRPSARPTIPSTSSTKRTPLADTVTGSRLSRGGSYAPGAVKVILAAGAVLAALALGSYPLWSGSVWRQGSIEPPASDAPAERLVMTPAPEDPTTELAEAYAALVTNRLEEGEALARRVLARAPTNHRAHGLLASILFERYWVKSEGCRTNDSSLLAEIDRERRAGSTGAPRDAMVVVATGMRELCSGRNAAAIAALEEAVALEPDSAYAQHQLGFALSAAGRHRQAVARFQQALELAPGMAWVHANLGFSLVMLERWGEALPHVRQVLAEDPKLADTHYLLARCLSGLGRFEEARQALGRAIERAPREAAYRAELAAVLLELGDEDAAYKEAKRAKRAGLRSHQVFGRLGM